MRALTDRERRIVVLNDILRLQQMLAKPSCDPRVVQQLHELVVEKDELDAKVGAAA